MTEFYIKPADQRLVRDPVSGAPLNADGEYKPMNSYWLRRRKDGDVVEAAPKKPVKKG